MRNKYPIHIFLEEKKEILALCESSLAARAISARMKSFFLITNSASTIEKPF